MKNKKTIPASQLYAKNTVKLKDKKGKASEKFKSKTVDINKDGSGTSYLKLKTNKRGASKESFKGTIKKKNGKFYMMKCPANKKKACTEKEISKARAERFRKRMTRKGKRLTKR